MRTTFALAATLALVLAAACGGGGGGDSEGEGDPSTATIVIADDEGGRAEVTVELARTPTERSRGLMLREELPEARGMLFVFADDTMTAFWMKDTSIPLSIVFIAADGAILDIQDMEPLSTELHYPPGPYRYGLEVNQGWFGRHGFEVGDRVEIPDSVAEEE